MTQQTKMSLIFDALCLEKKKAVLAKLLARTALLYYW